MAAGSALGVYLRARRELVRPENVGLRTSGRRRVPGLRREELAMLAGISPDYYVRLEQGRDHHPSPQVLDALARALCLDEEATVYLYALSQPGSGSPRPAEPERVPASAARLITLWPNTPAYVQGRYLDVLAANTLAIAVSPVFRPGTNLVRAVFLDAEFRRSVPDWDVLAETAAGRLRARLGADVEDPHLVALVTELSRRSEQFRRLWARHEVAVAAPYVFRLIHPLVGALELTIDRFPISGVDSQSLVVWHADPDSPTGRALTRLTRLASRGVGEVSR